jgi:hypothetical protein
MWEAAAYSQNLLKVMLDPPTWILAAIAIFALKRWSLAARIAVALAASAAFSLIYIVWPAGDSGRPFAWKALMFEFVATAAWIAVFLLARRLSGRKNA